jgi:hypothetical protein
MARQITIQDVWVKCTTSDRGQCSKEANFELDSNLRLASIHDWAKQEILVTFKFSDDTLSNETSHTCLEEPTRMPMQEPFKHWVYRLS